MSLVERGKKVYEKIYPDIKHRAGQFVAIEVDSEEFFIAKDLTTAFSYARAKFPDKQFYFQQIGTEVVSSFK